ncbi:MAG: transcription termination factor Rho [Lachnospiraceae bacterium]|nr:transcription termination factor Rho [Lachnospiraceae bacterium]
MSIIIEDQSLPTLKEWAKLLGIKGTSTFRKPQMVDLMNRVGAERIEKALRLAGIDPDKAAEAPAEAPAAEAPAEKPAENPAPAEPTVGGRPRSRWTSISKNFSKPEAASASAEAAEIKARTLAKPINDAPDDNSEISEPEEGTAARPRRIGEGLGITAPQSGRYTGRGGFGTYSASYLAQTEKPEDFERSDKNDRAPVHPERVTQASSGRTFTAPVQESREETEPAEIRIRRDAPEPRAVRVRDSLEVREIRAAEAAELRESKDEMPQGVPTGDPAHGILEVLPDGFGFIRSENFMPGDSDVYVSPSQIHRFGLKTGDVIRGITKARTGTEKFAALLYIETINDEDPEAAAKRTKFEDLTPVFPDERIHLETETEARAMRIMDLMAPIGKGQRGMIVSPPKAGKTTLIKEVAKAVTKNHPDIHILILLIDERPEEVTDIRESIGGDNVEVIYSTFDETPDHHRRVAEMVLGRAQRLVEHGRDVMILLDSITRLSRAYNLLVTPSGRTLSGGLDPAALYMPKKFFGAARNIREGGSLTILATALVETGSRMDDIIFEEFKGTGNMELVLDRKLSERRIFPAINILKSGTRRDDLLLTKDEQEITGMIRQAISSQSRGEEALEAIIDVMRHTRSNEEFCLRVRQMRF